MVLGCYYLTIDRTRRQTGDGQALSSDVDEALMAYQHRRNCQLEAPCHIRMKRTIDGVEYTRMVETTIGRVIFNEAIPQDMGMQKRETVDDMFKLEIDEVVGKKQLGQDRRQLLSRPRRDHDQPRCWTTSRRWATSIPPARR